MSSIEEREQNLFNATATLAQFYDEIEGFMDLLFGSMERAGFSAKAERLRSGTFTIGNLPRRLLASATVIYVRDVGEHDDGVDDDVDDEANGEGPETAGMGKAELAITPDLRIPFASLYLYRPKTIPSVHSLEPPRLLVGALGSMRFLERKTGQPVVPESPSLALSNLVQIPIGPESKVGSEVHVRCWRPKAMKRFTMEATIVAVEGLRLLEVDSQEKIQAIAKKLEQFSRV